MKLGFRGKIYWGFFSLILIQSLVLLLWGSHVMKESMLEEIKSHGVSIGITLSARMTEPLLAMDFLRMKTLVDETADLEDDIFYSFVLDEKGDPLVHTFKDGFPLALKTANIIPDNRKGSMQILDIGNQFIYDYAVPIQVNDHQLGTLRLGLFQTRAKKAVNKIIISAAVTILVTILVAGILGTLLLNPVTKNIQKLHDSTQQALRGNLDVKTAPVLKENCWDIMQCHKSECPAYKNYHHRCWYMAGTLCPTCVEGEYAKKIESCQQCQVYRKCSGDEIQSLAESFDTMTLSLKGNLSDLKIAEQVLKEQKSLLQTILDAIPDFISLQDHQGKYISVNRAFCEMLNKNKQEIIGRTNHDLFPPKWADQYTREDKRLFETGHTLVKENRIVRLQKSKWLHVVKIPVLEENGLVQGLVCSGRDITQLKEVQAQLTHSQKMESVGRLAAGVAHEINTPLGIILGYAQLLLEDVEKDGVIYKDITTIVKQTKICSRIVADLLNFSRSNDSIVTEFDINKTIEEVLEVVEHTFSLDHVKVKRGYHEHPLMMKGDKEKLKQVFINLLNNAFDATMEKGGSIFVDTGIEKDKNNIKISISDTGHGIAKENIGKIFEPFYTTKGPDKGTGLGLSVTFGIIKEHNGSIHVFSPPKSREGEKKGAQFIVVFPCSGLYTKKGEVNGEHSRVG